MSGPDGGTLELHTLLHQAHALIERRRFTQAGALVAVGLKDYPDNSQLQYLGAFIDYSEGRHQDALDSVHSVLSRDPQHYGSRLLLAELYEAKQEYGQAERTWIELLREYPESSDCYAAYAELLLRALRIEKAEHLVQEGLRHDPSHEKCLYVATLLQVIRGKRGAADNEHLQRLVQDHPERVNTLIALVVTLQERGDNQNALRVAQQLLRSQPDSVPFLNLVRQLKLRNHWSLWPLYPVIRWGWVGTAAVAVAVFICVQLAESSLPKPVASWPKMLWIGYVVYSWVWPPFLRKLL